jgi:para-nitrobenzyl esterase
MVSLATAEHIGAASLAKIGAASIADARKMPAEAIMKGVTPGLAAGPWPDFDGYVLPGDQYKLYEADQYNDTPVLIGTNADEGALFVASAKSATYLASIHSGYGDYADKILSVYPGATDAEALRSSRDMFRDTTFAWPTWAWARLQSRTGKAKVFVYYFSHRPPYPNMPQFKDWGASHGSEMSYVFGNFTGGVTPSADDKAVADQVSSYWVNFAKTGDPNGLGLPAWPAFADADQQVMNLNDPSKAIPVPNLEKLKVLDGYYAWRRSQATASH